jgi:hypothetical protein
MPFDLSVPPCEHKYVFLRSEDREIRWRTFATVDTFFCEKCLNYREVEKEKQPQARW